MARVLAPNALSITRSFAKPQGWKYTLAIVFAAQMVSAVGFSIVFPFLPLYIESLGSTFDLNTEMLAGMVISAQGLTMMIAAPIWGALADRFGRKKMIMRALWGGALMLTLMGVVQSAEQLILLRAIQGLVTGTLSASNALVAANTPRERVGFAMGTLQVALWGGVAIGPLIGGVLADHFGYGIPFLFTAVLLSVGGLIVAFGIQENFVAPNNRTTIRPTEILGGWLQILRAPGVSLVLMLRFLVGLGRSIIIPIAPLFVVSLIAGELESGNTYAGLVLAVSSGTSTLGAVYLGNLGDRISHRKVLLFCSTAAALLYIPQVFVADVWQLLALQGLSGIAAGGLVAAPTALLSHYTKRGMAGAVYGLDNSVWSGARAAAPLVGASVAIWFGMRGAFAVAAVTFAAIALTTWLLLPADRKQRAA